MKFIKKLIFAILILIIIVFGVIFYMGYSMYNKAISEISISERIKDIKSDKNYTSFNEIPDNFKTAIISIEDHRFYTHTGIDLITTTRSMIENIKEKDIVAGGSTISQQVRKTIIFYPRTTLF